MNSAHVDTEKTVYIKAASIVTEYVESRQLQPSVPEEDVFAAYKWFQELFSPEKLKEYSDDELLQKMFLTANSDNSSLCYHLEFNSKIKNYFGSISGGSSFKFGLFQCQEDGKWMTGSPQKQTELSDADALTLGKQIRDYLVQACEYIASVDFVSVHDYESLDDKLNTMSDKFASLAWIQKYFQMIFPDKFIGWYAKDWQNHMLFSFGIMPSAKYYARNGQLALIRKETRYNNTHFQDVCYQLFGDIKHFYRLGSSDDRQNYAEHWKSSGIIAIGWNEVGDLIDYVKNGEIDREKLADKLKELYYPNDAKTASRKAGEIKTFYEASSNAIFVVMDGDRLFSFVEKPTPCYYDESEPMSHCRKGSWLLKFEESEQLPESEGKLTSCYELRKQSNLLFLYQRFLDRSIKEIAGSAAEQEAGTIIVDESTRFSGGKNVLLYGVPGSGKSWTIEHEYCSDESVVERLVFHPDYTNSDFVGQILPVVDKKHDNQVTYEFTPGPFTTILRDAYANPRQEFILIIEELNRGNAPAIFGDIFQLLDRMVVEKTVAGIKYHVGTSEYEITNKNVAEIVYRDVSRKIRIPSNLSILATMNTSDQNVFTLDTAFQRRWKMRLIENSFENVRPSLANYPILDTEVTWRRFCETINKQIVGNKAKMASSEDKRLGVYFVHESDLKHDNADEPLNHDTIRAELNELLTAEMEGTITDEQNNRLRVIRAALIQNRIFPEKVIKYLWDDAFKFNPGAVFDTEENKDLDSLEAVIRMFVYDNRGKDRFRIFKSQIRDLLYEP